MDKNTGETIFRPYGYNEVNGEWVSYRCERNVCEACVVINARRIAGAIHLSKPTHALSLTLVGDDYRTICKTMGYFSNCVRQTIPSFRWAWAVEMNPGETGCHVHGYFHCDAFDFGILPDVLDEARVYAGVGKEMDFNRIDDNADPTYFGYPMKSLVDPDLRETFLNLNGLPTRRFLIHSSQSGFWREGAGGRILRREEAEIIAHRQSSSMKYSERH